MLRMGTDASDLSFCYFVRELRLATKRVPELAFNSYLIDI